MMALGAASMYEPVIDKDYSDEEIEGLYQKALDRYVEEERAAYDEPPELIFDEDGDPEEDLEMFRIETEEYENREPFDEEEAEAEFEEMYRDNLEEPDEDLPDWVRDAVDTRILAMYFMPEKIYRKLSEQDEANEERFDELDERADEALEYLMENLPEEYAELTCDLEELESATVVEVKTDGGEIGIILFGWDEDGEEMQYKLLFSDAEVIENEGVDVSSWVDEDGDTDSDCELLYSEVYLEDGRPEIHMMFDNNGLKYLTFRCSEAGIYEVHQ